MRVPHRCWVLLSPVSHHCLLFTSTASVPHSLSHRGRGQPAVPIGSVGAHVRGVRWEKRLFPQAEGTQWSGWLAQHCCLGRNPDHPWVFARTV